MRRDYDASWGIASASYNQLSVGYHGGKLHATEDEQECEHRFAFVVHFINT
jgi:hypothetical protein